MIKKIAVLVIPMLLVFSVAQAVSTFNVSQGGTGVSTLTGIPYGSGTSPFGTVTIGTGLIFSTGTLTATGGAGSAVVIGGTTITGGTTGRVFYDNAGVLGEMTTTGSGTVLALATSPTFVTPTLGVASATSLNKLIITVPASSATLTIADGKTLTASNSITLAGTDGKGINIGAATTGTILIGNGSNMVLSTSTYPSSAGTNGFYLVSDGTNWTSAALTNASATVAGVVEEATASEFNAGTQTGGTGAELFLNPSILSGKNINGMLGNNIPKTWFNYQIPFILWTGAVVNDATTTFVNWVRNSTDVNVQSGGGGIYFSGTGADSIYLDRGMFYNSSPNVAFNSSSKVAVDFFAQMAATNTGDLSFGFGNVSASSYNGAYNATGTDRVQFNLKSTGELYATTSVAAGSTTNTQIMGITVSTFHDYRIELDASSAARFYIDGVLKATITTTLPSTSDTISLGFGRSNTATFVLMAPNVAMQMI